MKKHITILIKAMLSSSFVFSQNYADILKLQVSTTPNNAFESSAAGTRLNELMGDLTVPVKINTQTSFISGMIYEDIHTKLFAEGNMVRFASTTLKLGVNTSLNHKWTTTCLLLPKIASDYSSYSNKDFQFGAAALFKYKKRENLNYKLGLYYNGELFGPFFVPMLGLYYQSPNKKFETNIVLPLQADANYKLFDFMSLGCNFNGQIRSYHLNDMTTTNSSTYVVKSTNELFAYLKFDIANGLSVQTKAGHSIGRSYKVFDESDNVTFGLPATFIGPKREQLNTNFSDGLIYQVALNYRVNL